MAPSDHARLGASNSSGWLVCTKQPDMSEGRERKATVYTAEGSAAHAFAEGVLLETGTPAIGDTVSIDSFDVQITNEMAQNVYVYTDECFRIAEDADDVQIEERVYLDELWAPAPPPEPLFGTADFRAIVKDTYFLRDLKFGKGVPVEVKNNTQLLYYGLGGYFALNADTRAKIEWFDLGIVQPRVDHPDGKVRSLTIHKNDLLNWGMNELRPTVDNIVSGKTRYTTGKHCRWCVASGSCEALASRAMTEAKTTFAETTPVAPGQLSDLELGAMLDALPVIEGWTKSVRAEAMSRILDGGRSVPGWKTVPKRAIRTWTDDRAVLDVLRAEGVNPKDIAEVKIGTVAAIEKFLKQRPEVFDKVRSMIDGSSSGYTLAPVDDPRSAVTSTRQDAVFESVDPSAIEL